MLSNISLNAGPRHFIQRIQSMNKRVRVGIVGSQFISSIHADSLKHSSEAELFAIASPTPGNAKTFAEKNGVPHHFTDYKKMLEMDEVDMIIIGTPNDT